MPLPQLVDARSLKCRVVYCVLRVVEQCNAVRVIGNSFDLAVLFSLFRERRSSTTTKGGGKKRERAERDEHVRSRIKKIAVLTTAGGQSI